MDARERELAALRQELAELKQSTTLQLEEAERIRVAEIREMRGQLEEREREVAALKGELAGHKDAHMKLDVESKISESVGDQQPAWEAIKSASQVAQLDLKHLSYISDTMLGHVSTMTHLKKISLQSSSGFSEEGIKHLYRLPRLESLNVQFTDMSDSALKGIGSLISLKHLYLGRTNVTTGGLVHLTGLSSLKTLALTECKGVTNAGMVHVGRLTGLEELALYGTAVTDYGLQQLTALTKLTKLCPSKGCLLFGEDVRRRIGM
ncbi:unnamed protein product [Closterium sp. Yama58-4]|nr:unnamed protein product [Closterium sp. Yama58-4]